ncbi:SRPBCC domain-containing protein [Yoonia sp. I 8.24]|uniref:SRPBCC family protein n=1 Tax=Yoonia sp. I 8.24 TaxID=1537229 RepID=UPI001EE0A5FF|nr:SRPBCC domain-containing protein [Yoonia sp. I 8.24]MCG3268798.1 SRPBCC domain-containing protein [Yoonia sp. I 8.24]
MAESTNNYQEKIQVSASQDACFKAVATQMEKWWTETIEGGLKAVGDKVTARFPPDYGYWTFEASVMKGSSRLEMICVDAHHRVEGQPKEIDQEWLGTKIIWEFEVIAGKTEITMTHDGLTPTLNCWGICLDGWNHFLKTSLKAYLDGDEPRPHSYT